MKQRAPVSGNRGSRNRWPFVALCMTLVGVPLLIAPGVVLYYDITPKVALLLLGTAAVLLMSRSWFGGFQLAWRDRLGRVCLILLAAQLASLSLSTVFSTQPDLSFGGSNWRRLGLVPHAAVILFAMLLLAFLAAHRDRLHPLLRCFAAGGLAAAVYGVLQYFAIDPLVPPDAYHFGEGEMAIVRTPGTLGHAGYFATFLLTAVFGALALARVEASRPWRIVALAAAVLGSFAVVLSGTRGAILGLLAGFAIAALWRRRPLHRRAVAGVILAAFALGVFYVSPLGEKLRGRTRWSIEDAAGGGRLLLWRDSLRMFAAGPWLTGTGLETYSAAFPGFLSPDLAKTYPNRYYESPHNAAIDALTSQGLLGLAILLGTAATVLTAAWRLRKLDVATVDTTAGDTSAGDTVAGMWLAAAFVAALCSNQFLAFTLPTALCFYAGAAWLVVLGIPQSEAIPANAAPRWSWPATAAIAALLALYAVQLSAADYLLLRVKQHAAAGDIRGAFEGYKRVVRFKPWGMNADLSFSRWMMAASQRATTPNERLQAWDAAKGAGARAAERAAERQAACYNLAVLHGLSNDAREAEAALRRTIAVAPAWYKPRWMLAQLLRESGRQEEARREAGLASELNGGANPEVQQTWDELRSLSGGAQ